MKIIDRLVLTIHTIILSIFYNINFNAIRYLLSKRKLNIYLKVVKNNYFISIIGLTLLIASIRFLISGITTNKRNYIITNISLGELSKKVIEEFKDVNDTKSSVKILDEEITLKVNGVVD